ncbi:MAG TPA: hypothetical protein VGO66_11295 [Solirubrobacterales bacterium]|jgi:hypothetical protein|nr:hypothetical protein [Solirubrobacterales bacterium]
MTKGTGGMPRAKRLAEGAVMGKAKIASLLLVVCLLLVSAGSAWADEESDPIQLRPTLADIHPIRGQSAQALEAEQMTDPAAADQLPHTGLNRDQASQLVQEVFAPALQAPAGIFDELEVEKFYSSNVALVESDGLEINGIEVGESSAAGSPSGLTLLESTVPLRVSDSSGQPAPVDLGLESAGGDLQSANPLVEAGIPGELGDGISLGGLGIELSDAPQQRTPTVIEDSVAFYPNVALDTDFLVAPTPTGLETLTQLRSADAPRSQTFDLQLPDGASLVSDGEGGARVNHAGAQLLSVPAPMAIDAEGQAVAVSMDVSGDSLILHVSPDASSAYPILVDPLYQYYSWFWTNASVSEWLIYQNANNVYQANPYAACGQYCPSPLFTNVPGLYIGAGSGYVPSGGQATWSYYVPRFFQDAEAYGVYPTTWIESMTVQGLGFWAGADHSVHPGLVFGVWNLDTSQWAAKNTAAIWHGGNEPDLTNFGTTYSIGTGGDHGAKVGHFAMNSSTNSLTSYRQAYVGAVTIGLGDPDVPKFGPVSSPGWVDGNSGSPPVNFEVSDAGLGVYALALSFQGEALNLTGGICRGDAGEPCPRTWSSTDANRPHLDYEISRLPQGINNLQLSAQDPVGNSSTPAAIQVKVDRTAPELIVSGSLSNASEPIRTPTLTLDVKAKDGSTAAPQSGVESLEFKIDGNQVWSSSCATQSCEIHHDWTFSATQFSVGSHDVVLKAIDRVGRVGLISSSFMIYHDETPPEISNPDDPSLISTVSGPGGWLNNDNYNLTQKIFDNDLGVKKAEFLVDGVPVGPTASCQGTAKYGCSTSLSLASNVSELSGGTHVIQLKAEDLRGNKASRSWTIRVNPDGEISAGEAIDLLEAAEETDEQPAVPSLSPVAPTPEVLEPAVITAGDNPGLEEQEGTLKSTGVPVATSIDPSTGAVTLEGATDTVEFTPTGQQPSDLEIANGVAAVSSSVLAGVDTSVRPEFNGVFAFQAIRELTSPEKFEWHVNVPPEQELRQLDAEHAEMVYEDGTVALSISAEPAHDATGKAVPTQLDVTDGSNLVLTVAHKSSNYVYPVVAGQAFEVGYAVVTVVEPALEEEQGDPGTPFRDPFPPTVGESLTSGEVRRLLAIGKDSSGQAPPASASKTRIFEVDMSKCHPDTCKAYEVRMHDAAFKRETSSVEWIAGTTITCSGDIDFPFTLSTNIDIINTDFVGPSKVVKGSGKHLTVWCHFKLHVWVVPDPGLPGVPKPWATRAMQVWVYPNGFQEIHMRKWDEKVWIYEN